jgi:hypothetical protein
VNVSETLQRPRTLRDVADSSFSLADFGRNLRDWQHEIQRGGVNNRQELAQRLVEEPTRLDGRFPQGDLADAHMAAYAEWLADQAGIPRPPWCADPERVAKTPWFGSPLRGWLLAHTPASFRQRNLFTLPEALFTPKPGRPRKSPEHKAHMAAERQRAYRRRIRVLVQKARALNS